MATGSEFRLLDIVELTIKRRKLIGTCVALCVALAIVAGFFITPAYRAEALVIPVDQSSGVDGLGSLGGQLGGIAAIAGLALPGRQDKTEFIATLSSRQLAAALIVREDMLETLFSTRDIRFLPTVHRRPPTMGDALQLFDRSVREVREDVKTGLVTVSVEWYDRALAAKWANELVEMANDYLRLRAISEAERAIDLLQKEALQAATVELKDAIYRLIEAQIKARTVATVHRDYAFRVIDPAIVPDADKRVRPARTIMAIVGAALGLLVGLFLSSVLEKKQAASSNAG